MPFFPQIWLGHLVSSVYSHICLTFSNILVSHTLLKCFNIFHSIRGNYVNRVSVRLMSMQLVIKKGRSSIISAYAPQV